MRFARRVFTAAGIYGVCVILPMYFLENRIGQDQPPAITHPEFFYGWVGLALVWQFVFLAIGRDPIRLRPMMLMSILEKLSFALAAPILYAMGRTSGQVVFMSCIDMVLGVLFFLSWRATAAEDQVTPDRGRRATA